MVAGSVDILWDLGMVLFIRPHPHSQLLCKLLSSWLVWLSTVGRCRPRSTGALMHPSILACTFSSPSPCLVNWALTKFGHVVLARADVQTSGELQGWLLFQVLLNTCFGWHLWCLCLNSKKCRLHRNPKVQNEITLKASNQSCVVDLIDLVH